MAFTTAELKKLKKENPNADPDLFKLASAGAFNKTPAPAAPLSNSQDGYSVDGVMFRNDEQATRSGYYGEEAADDLFYKEAPFVQKRLTKAESKGFAADYGLMGLNEKDFEGLTKTQAEIKAKRLQQERQGQTSALTSYRYNPQAISGFRDVFNELKLSLDTQKDDPFTPNKMKKEKNQTTIKSYTDQLAGLFGSQEEFLAAQKDPEMRKILRQYESIGGSRNDVAANIGKNVSVTGEVDNPDGTSTVSYSDGQQRNVRYQQNPDGSMTPVFENANSGDQTIDQYLGSLNKKEDQMAMETLLPEKQIAQDQIAFEMSVPEAYKQYYFGTPEQVGLLERKEAEAKETIKLIERKAQAEERNTKAMANLASQKASAEREQANAEIEKNRLTAKNYMMGQLAKLGALNTTGAAPMAIASLEQKYQQQAQQLNTKYEFAERELSVKLREAVDNIELERDENILKVKEDVTKSEEDAWKEIFKLEIAAKKSAFSTITSFASKFRTQTESYRKELKSDAEKYAKELAKKASSYNGGAVSIKVREGDVLIPLA